MNASEPFPYVSLDGFTTIRGVTLEWPTDRVRGLLPHGLELGAQTLTRPGTHPVVVHFNDIVRAHMSIPSLLPSLSYFEHILGIPHCYVTAGSIAAGAPGPFFHMPRLHLDSVLATLGGVLYWGFPKSLAQIALDECSFTVSGRRGNRLTTLWFRPGGEFRPLAQYASFEPIRQLLCQPLVSLLPLALGPCFVCSNYDKQWEVAALRPLESVHEIYEAYVPGLDAGRWPEHGIVPGIDRSVLGSYEIRAPWRLSMPYPPHVAPQHAASAL